MFFTIQAFSKRTGLPPSKLRFYDKKKLLQPSARLDNGYRVYTEDQIHLAKMIDSLRQADVPISEIKRYSTSDEQEKKILLKSWQEEIDKKIELLRIGRQYLGGLHMNAPKSLLLTKWERDKYFIWKKCEVERKPHPFQKSFLAVIKILQRLGIEHHEEVYVKTVSVQKDTLIGEVGFEIKSWIDLEADSPLRMERIPPTLFAVLQDCQADNAFLCFSYIQVVIRYGFQPAGYKLEKYSSINALSYDYLIPILNEENP